MRHPASPNISIENTNCLTKERKDIVSASYNAIGTLNYFRRPQIIKNQSSSIIQFERSLQEELSYALSRETRPPRFQVLRGCLNRRAALVAEDHL
jgi:hypothetical protein